MRHGLVLFAIAMGSMLFAADAFAQAPRRQMPASRPTVSPYLNLLNNNNPNVTNYQSLVRPQVNQARVNSNQAAQINRLQAKPPKSGNAGNESLRSTGHQATWNNYSHYYPRKR
jgi:hypothetical protein